MWFTMKCREQKKAKKLQICTYQILGDLAKLK